MSKDKIELEKSIKNIKNSYIMSTKHCLDDENIQLKQDITTVLQALNNFIFVIEEKTQALEETTEDRDMYLRQLNRVFDNGFISKKKIEDNIEELKKKVDEYENYKADGDFMNFFGNEIRKVNAQIFILQELLEDK